MSGRARSDLSRVPCYCRVLGRRLVCVCVRVKWRFPEYSLCHGKKRLTARGTSRRTGAPLREGNRTGVRGGAGGGGYGAEAMAAIPACCQLFKLRMRCSSSKPGRDCHL